MTPLLTEFISGPFGSIKVTLTVTNANPGRIYNVRYSGYLISSDGNVASLESDSPQPNTRLAAKAFAERCEWAEKYTNK